ncbi:MAG: hypothetical protein ACRENY_03550 [Candidatus Dormibacteria bacterium]
MSRPSPGEVVVLARGELAQEGPALAVRVALALPLAGLRSRLLLTDSASALALEALPDLSPWSGALERELEALLGEDEGSVMVELESLVALGLDDRQLRGGIELATRTDLDAICAAADHCLVL